MGVCGVGDVCRPYIIAVLPTILMHTKTTNTVEPCYLELASFEFPVISKWKSGPCFNINYYKR